MSSEVWSQVEGLSRYLISSEGRVKNKNTKKILKHIATPSGVPVLNLQTDWNKESRYPVEWLVYHAFYSDFVRPIKIKNRDGNKANVRLSNLIVM